MRIGLDIAACSTRILRRDACGGAVRQVARFPLGSASVVWLDAAGTLRIGGCGTAPLPASQGGAGTDFTLADALLLLGMAESEDAAEASPLPDPLAAERAAEPLRRRLGLGMIEFAAAVRGQAVRDIAAALRPLLREVQEAGEAPGLFVEGAAGPALAAAIAETLGITDVTVQSDALPPPGEATEEVEPRLRAVVFDRRPVAVPCFDRDSLRRDGSGPALIAHALRTTVVPPGWSWRIGERRALWLQRVSAHA